MYVTPSIGHSKHAYASMDRLLTPLWGSGQEIAGQ
ncbi:Uncharacterised protein [Mycobacteroides abscessus subsp. abscessus]|nr:hypothetical protein M879_21070 [Mycobacteroides abscessus V06705]SKS03190.1 Uncharacterised protein [Mycobacteroides abscessus subsp. abscessus]